MGIDCVSEHGERREYRGDRFSIKSLTLVAADFFEIFIVDEGRK